LFVEPKKGWERTSFIEWMRSVGLAESILMSKFWAGELEGGGVGFDLVEGANDIGILGADLLPELSVRGELAARKLGLAIFCFQIAARVQVY